MNLIQASYKVFMCQMIVTYLYISLGFFFCSSIISKELFYPMCIHVFMVLCTYVCMFVYVCVFVRV